MVTFKTCPIGGAVGQRTNVPLLEEAEVKIISGSGYSHTISYLYVSLGYLHASLYRFHLRIVFGIRPAPFAYSVCSEHFV